MHGHKIWAVFGFQWREWNTSPGVPNGNSVRLEILLFGRIWRVERTGRYLIGRLWIIVTHLEKFGPGTRIVLAHPKADARENDFSV